MLCKLQALRHASALAAGFLNVMSPLPPPANTLHHPLTGLLLWHQPRTLSPTAGAVVRPSPDIPHRPSTGRAHRRSLHWYCACHLHAEPSASAAHRPIPQYPKPQYRWFLYRRSSCPSQLLISRCLHLASRLLLYRLYPSLPPSLLFCRIRRSRGYRCRHACARQAHRGPQGRPRRVAGEQDAGGGWPHPQG